MRTLAVVPVATMAAFSIVALVTACEVALTAGGDDAGGAGDGEEAGLHDDTGGGADVGTPDDTGGSDDAETGVDIGTADGGGLDGGSLDVGPQVYTFAGTITVEGNKPKNLAVVFILDGPPVPGSKPVANAPCDADGKFLIDQACDAHGLNCQPIGAGTYWLVAVYDSNDDMETVPDTGDPVGFHAGSPLTVPGAATTGLDIDIALSQFGVQSIYIDTTVLVRQPMAVLFALSASVRNPIDGRVITDATVTVADRTSGTITLVFDPQEEAYTWTMDNAGQQIIEALEGDYTFTVTHDAFGGAFMRKVEHHPLTSAVTIVSPTMDIQFAVPQSIVLNWTDPPTTVPNWIGVEEHKRSGQQVYSKPDQYGGPGPESPETIPASVFAPLNSYLIQVFSARTVLQNEGRSVEGALGVSRISFK